MLSLEFMFWSVLVAALLAFWWHSDRIKSLALQQVNRVCRQQALQLLDQTMVLRGLWVVRSPSGVLVLRRRYQFEFSSTGQARYRGEVILLGQQIISLDMEPHILPNDDQQLP
ncbi:MAG: DUF3301 domain-containing protein [Pseudohongiellaceae bacterium]